MLITQKMRLYEQDLNSNLTKILHATILSIKCLSNYNRSMISTPVIQSSLIELKMILQMHTSLYSASASYNQECLSLFLSSAKSMICSNDALSSLVFLARKRSRQGSSFSSLSPHLLSMNTTSIEIGLNYC